MPEQACAQLSIERRGVELVYAMRREPAELASFQCLRLSGPAGGCVKKNDNRRAALCILLLREGSGPQVVGVKVNAQLFLRLAHHRLGRRFTGFDLAAWILPQPAMVLVRRTLVHQHAACTIAQSERDDRQPCRVIFQFLRASQEFLNTSPATSPDVSYELAEGSNLEMIRFFRKLKQDDQGATAVEYGLIIALIFLAIAGSVSAFGQSTISMWDNVKAKVQKSNENANEE